MAETAIDSQSVIRELTQRGATKPCARCGGKQFSVEQGFVAMPVQTTFKSFSLGGLTIPAVVVVCNQCGAITLHSLGALGMLPKQGDEGQPADTKDQPTDAKGEAK